MQEVQPLATKRIGFRRDKEGFTCVECGEVETENVAEKIRNNQIHPTQQQSSSPSDSGILGSLF
jgi:hypothetical protein